MQDPAITQISQQRALKELKFQATRIVPLILPVIITCILLSLMKILCFTRVCRFIQYQIKCVSLSLYMFLLHLVCLTFQKRNIVNKLFTFFFRFCYIVGVTCLQCGINWTLNSASWVQFLNLNTEQPVALKIEQQPLLVMTHNSTALPEWHSTRSACAHTHTHTHIIVLLSFLGLL